ncbi:MAG TPA: DUF1569 domain-containing protein [Bryobacteraceae bacterium]|nr:DUF1569 domain-containing protein [Bryobacteraceae bacterium]
MLSLRDTAARQDIVQRINRLGPNTVRVWGRMTAPEMICHLNDSFLVSLGDRTASSRANMFSRTAMKFFALNVPMQWPKNLPTMPEVKQGLGGTCPSDFQTDRINLLSTLDRFCVPDPTVGRFPHPLFGMMSVEDWMRWGYLHSDHHLRQFGI